MGVSPAVSPRPNQPTPKAATNASRAKALAFHNHSRNAPSSAAASAAPTLGIDPTQDLAEQMNDQIRQSFVSGKKLGEGTYAIVYEGHFRNDPSKLVAIKKIKLNAEYKDGIAQDAIREMRTLPELDHPHIIKLFAVFNTKDQNISLVLEHLPRGDLEQLWKDGSIMYSGADIKSWGNMLCQAVWFCHESRVLHRDIKGNNVLVAADNTLKLADFGLARSMADPGRAMSHMVITRFYRPPELFLGAQHYGGCVDIWSTACVIAELAIRTFFLAGDSDIGCLERIIDVFGIPTEQDWPGISSLRFWDLLKTKAPKRPQPMSFWRQRFPLMGEDGVDLLRGMMIMDPRKRLTAEQVLRHPYWTNQPRPTKTENLPQRGKDEKKMGEDLKRAGGEIESGRTDKVARKLNFG